MSQLIQSKIMNEPKISEMAINVKVKFSEAIASTDKVLENIRQALLRQVEELGISPSDEEGAVENIVFEYQGQEVFVCGTKKGKMP